MFTPSGFSATVGDTVEWNWINGGHTTTSRSGLIPLGAAIWSHPMNDSSTTFQYVIRVAGTYIITEKLFTLTLMEARFLQLQLHLFHT